jgi:3-deoxy-D-manno-octulosonic-acid transferase
MLLLIYNLLLLPILMPYLAWRLLIRGKSREGLAERFGSLPNLGPAPLSGRIWVHAVSVGETVAAAPVVSALRDVMPGAEILLSTVTPSGQAQARRAVPDVARHFFFPFDLPWVVGRVLSRLQPSAIVLMEAEIWPNLLFAAHRRGIPVLIANGHISDRTLRRGQRLRPLLAPLYPCITRYLAQSPAIAERAKTLGLPPARVVVAGHTKFDQHVPSFSAEELNAMRAELALAPGQPLFLAGSTHEGEEEQVLAAWEAARRRVPSLALMLAPRHLQRVGAIRSLIEQRGLAVRLRSNSGAQKDPPEHLNTRTPEHLNTVLLLDTMGELASMFGLADAAFVGGSLVPKGGHDILQPLFHGVPTLFGPHMHNQRALTVLALEAGAARQVTDAHALGDALTTLLTDSHERERMRSAAARLLAENRGAAARCASEVARLVTSGDQELLRPAVSPCLSGEAPTQ